MKFLIDHQLPPALARFLENELGAEAIHVIDAGMEKSSDDQIWSYASENSYVLVSKDEDFVSFFLRAPTAKLLWVRIGNCRKAHLLSAFQSLWPEITGRLGKGEQFLELR